MTTTELIQALQEELKFALEVFWESCDCGQCGPCRRQDRMMELAAHPVPSALEHLAEQAE